MSSGIVSQINTNIESAKEKHGGVYGAYYTCFSVIAFILISITVIFRDEKPSKGFAEWDKEVSNVSDKYGSILGVGYMIFGVLLLTMIALVAYFPVVGIILFGAGVLG